MTLPLPNKSPATHVIFDMDGVLLDTEDIYTEIMNDIFKPYGKAMTWDEKVRVMGMESKSAVPKILEMMGLTDVFTPETYMKEFVDRQAVFFAQIRLKKGVTKTVAHLKQHNIPICVATSSHSEIFALKTRNFPEFFSQFDHIVTGDNPNVAHGKPSPDIFQYAASLFKDNPESPAHCLVFEDSPNGVQAALSANMQCVMLPNPQLKPEYINHSITQAAMDDIKFEEYNLPPFACEN